MATEKVMITISGLQDHEVILASDSQHGKVLHQVDLFEAADSLPEAPACPEDQLSSTLAKAPPEAAGAPQAFEASQYVDKVGISAPVPARAAVATTKPWEVASSAPTGATFRPAPSLHAKMEWVSANVPGGMSRQRILREGAELLCDRLIALHYKG